MGDKLHHNVTRAICMEQCAFMGEPPCWSMVDDVAADFPPPSCDEPGCAALARAAIRVVLEEAAKVTAMIPASMIGSTDSYAKGYKESCYLAAAAIRSMMPEASNDRA